jgi:hypothetical protein
MSNNLLIEELKRIHEMMGIKPKTILSEASTTRPKSGAFDVNLNPAIKSEIETAIVDWANTAVGLTKNGSRTTMSDLVEAGKRYAREFGQEATDNAEALYFLALKSGRKNFNDIVNTIATKIQRQAEQEFSSKLSSLTDKYAADQLKNMLKKNSVDLTSLDVSQIQALSNNLKSLRDSIDSSSLDPSLKTQLKEVVTGQIDTYETAASRNYASRDRSLPSDIGGGSSTVSSGAEQRWEKAKAKAQSTLGRQIDDSDPVIQNIKRTIDSSTDEELSNMIINYVNNQGKLVREGSAAEKKAAQENLNNFGKLLETLTGGLFKSVEKGSTTAGNLLIWMGKNKKYLIPGTLLLVAALQLPDILEFGKDIADYSSYRSEYECWENVTNFEQYLDWQWFPGGANQLAEFIMAQFKTDELLEYVCGGGISAVYYSEIETGSWKGGIEVRFDHSNGCSDSLEIRITDGEFSGTRWKNNKRCNESAGTEIIDTDDEGESKVGEFKNTYEGFESWGQSQDPKLSNSDGSIYWDEESTQGFIKDSNGEYQAVNYSDGTFDNPLD